VKTPDTEEAIDDLIELGSAVGEAGLAEATAGNVSVRLDEARMLLSATGCELGALTTADVAVVALKDGNVIEGPEPSLERELHRRVYTVREAAGAILHCQSPAATLLACRDDPPTNLDFVPEIPAYVRAHAYVPYSMPGSEPLAESVARAFEDPEVTVVQMRNHGQVVIGSTWRKAIRRAAFFELACWMATRDPSLRTIPSEDAARLRAYARDV
jgi:ribulose-5-phosphate 4-epimerase/fuculose-1-phosphate aldolase